MKPKKYLIPLTLYQVPGNLLLLPDKVLLLRYLGSSMVDRASGEETTSGAIKKIIATVQYSHPYCCDGDNCESRGRWGGGGS